MIGTRTLVGAALLARPRPLLAALSGHSPDEHAIVFARVLGARHLSEAAVLWRWTTPAVVRTGAVVDAIHAVSALALVKTRHQPRLAALNVVSATTFALLGAALARRIDHTSTSTIGGRSCFQSGGAPTSV